MHDDFMVYEITVNNYTELIQVLKTIRNNFTEIIHKKDCFIIITSPLNSRVDEKGAYPYLHYTIEEWNIVRNVASNIGYYSYSSIFEDY